jgi:hypothetical protein
MLRKLKKVDQCYDYDFFKFRQKLEKKLGFYSKNCYFSAGINKTVCR